MTSNWRLPTHRFITTMMLERAKPSWWNAIFDVERHLRCGMPSSVYCVSLRATRARRAWGGWTCLIGDRSLSAREILGMQKSNAIVRVGGGVGYQNSIVVEQTLHDHAHMRRCVTARVSAGYADLKRARRARWTSAGSPLSAFGNPDRHRCVVMDRTNHRARDR